MKLKKIPDNTFVFFEYKTQTNNFKIGNFELNDAIEKSLLHLINTIKNNCKLNECEKLYITIIGYADETSRHSLGKDVWLLNNRRIAIERAQNVKAWIEKYSQDCNTSLIFNEPNRCSDSEFNGKKRFVKIEISEFNN